MLKLEDFKSEIISSNHLSNLRGGEEIVSSGNVEINYQGTTHTGSEDKMTRENGKITCLEIYSNGVWKSIV
jgi:hypothetical protein